MRSTDEVLHCVGLFGTMRLQWTQIACMHCTRNNI